MDDRPSGDSLGDCQSGEARVPARGWVGRGIHAIVRRLRMHRHLPLVASTLVIAVLATAIVVVGATRWQRDIDEHRSHVIVAMEHAALHIAEHVSEREQALSALAHELAGDEAASEETFRQKAATLRHQLPGVAAMAWVDTAGEVEWLAPTGAKSAPPIPGIPPAAELGPLASKVARDGKSRITSLRAGPHGTATFVMLVKSGEGAASERLLAAVLPVDDLMSFQEGRAWALPDGVTLRGASIPAALAETSVPYLGEPVVCRMTIFGQELNLVAPPPYTIVSRLLGLSALLLAGSIALGVLVGWLVNERQRLYRNQLEFDLILNSTTLRIIYKDDKNRILRLNEAAARFHGLTVEAATGMSGYEVFPKYAKARHEEDLEIIRSGKPHSGDVKEMGSRDGVTLWGRADKIPYKDPLTGDDRLLMVATDVTEQVNAQHALRRSEERYNLAIEMSSIGTWDWNIATGEHYWSPRNRELFGLTDPTREVSVEEFRSRLHPDDRERVIAAQKAHLENHEPYLVEFRARQDSGSYVWIRTRGQAVWDDEGRPIRMAGSSEDITERVNLQHRLAQLAHNDTLTGLANRVLFRENLDKACADADAGEAIALLCIDLDGFKSVNDTLGHAAGDRQLKLVAGRLRGCVGADDMVARLGGDEFAIIHRSDEILRTASSLAGRVIDALGAPYVIEASQTVIGASAGLAIAPNDGTDPDRLMNRADLALYCAKQEGRGGFRFFEEPMEAHVKNRHKLGADLASALSNDELALHYQPLVSVESGEVTGFEALLRWRHPKRGDVPPNEFIPVAEECGLVNKIGEWVLDEACREAATWPDDHKIAVNVSPLQFRGGMLMLSVAQALAKSGLQPGRLELEITESVLLEDNDDSLAMLHQLHGLGVRISLDDFGTGYSSLSYLRRFPFDKIKIDASFISHIGGDGDDDLGIVQAIVSLANRLGVETTAEGVETEDQLAVVRAEGCTEMQGYLFSPPRPAGEIARMYLGRSQKAGNAG